MVNKRLILLSTMLLLQAVLTDVAMGAAEVNLNNLDMGSMQTSDGHRMAEILAENNKLKEEIQNLLRFRKEAKRAFDMLKQKMMETAQQNMRMKHMIRHIANKFPNLNIQTKKTAADPVELSAQQSAVGNILSQMSEKDLKDAVMSLLNLHSSGSLNPSKSPEASSKVEQMLMTLLKPGSSKISFGEGVFEGEIVNGRPNGKGQCQYKDNSRYKGEYHQGKKHGIGMYRWADGSTYSGEYFAGQKQGLGRMSYSEGDEYEGSWRDDKMHGWGITRFGPSNKPHDFMVNRWDGGEEEGEYFWVSQDRSQIKLGAYKRGKEHGERRVFQLTQVLKFKNGKPLE